MKVTIAFEGLTELLARFEALAGTSFAGGAVVGSSLGYARAVHEGTRPHLIVAKPGKALSWKGAAHPVRAVHHPGTRAQPFLRDALLSERAAVAARLAQGVIRLIEAGGGDFQADLMAAGLIVQAAAQRNAPVRTGTLRRSIHTQPYARG